MPEKWKEAWKRYWPPGKDQLLILVLAGLLLAVAAIPADPAGGGDKKRGEETQAEAPAQDGYEARMEQRLQELLSCVEGVGNVQVMLTFEGTGEKRVEKDRTVTENENREETVYEETESRGRVPYVISETSPEVAGVLVIAEGGDLGTVRQEILEAAQALFGIEAHKIKIMKMEGSK